MTSITFTLIVLKLVSILIGATLAVVGLAPEPYKKNKDSHANAEARKAKARRIVIVAACVTVVAQVGESVTTQIGSTRAEKAAEDRTNREVAEAKRVADRTLMPTVPFDVLVFYEIPCSDPLAALKQATETKRKRMARPTSPRKIAIDVDDGAPMYDNVIDMEKEYRGWQRKPESERSSILSDIVNHLGDPKRLPYDECFERCPSGLDVIRGDDDLQVTFSKKSVLWKPDLTATRTSIVSTYGPFRTELGYMSAKMRSLFDLPGATLHMMGPTFTQKGAAITVVLLIPSVGAYKVTMHPKADIAGLASTLWEGTIPRQVDDEVLPGRPLP